MALSQVGLERLNTATTKKIGKNKNLIIQEFIRGTEYNIDIFNDKFGNFLSCCIKKKY